MVYNEKFTQGGLQTISVFFIISNTIRLLNGVLLISLTVSAHN